MGFSETHQIGRESVKLTEGVIMIYSRTDDYNRKEDAGLQRQLLLDTLILEPFQLE